MASRVHILLSLLVRLVLLSPLVRLVKCPASVLLITICVLPLVCGAPINASTAATSPLSLTPITVTLAASSRRRHRHRSRKPKRDSPSAESTQAAQRAASTIARAWRYYVYAVCDEDQFPATSASANEPSPLPFWRYLQAPSSSGSGAHTPPDPPDLSLRPVIVDRVSNDSASVIARHIRRRSEQRRNDARRRISARPQAMYAFDVGYDAFAGSFIYRSPLGSISTVHPALDPNVVVPAFSDDGRIIEPLWPPPTSSLVLVPEATGAWCYYDTKFGNAQWHAPAGSSADFKRTLSVSGCFDTMPPMLDPLIDFGCLDKTSWISIVRDNKNVIELYNELTGAVRSAPWIALRTSGLAVYFANLLTRETRWFPPHRWMEDWISRPAVCDDERVSTVFDPLSVVGKRMLPLSLGRQRVEGGSPYLDAQYPSRPQYEPDNEDTPDTYPIPPVPP